MCQGKEVSEMTNYLGLYFPNESGYDGKYFLQVLRGTKKVMIFI